MLDKIRQACALANEVDNINRGGCCVFAALLGRKLIKLGIPAWGVALSRNKKWETSVAEARREVQERYNVYDWNYNGVSFDHVGVRFKLEGKYYQADSMGVQRVSPTLRDWQVLAGRFTIDEFEAFAKSNRGFWNEEFHRKTGIPAIKRAIKKGFQ